MRVLKWYSIALAVSALILTGLLYVPAYRLYLQRAPADASMMWVHNAALVELSSILSWASFALLGLTFFVGLAAVIRASDLSALSLAPALLVFAVGAVVSVAEVVSWYVGTSVSDSSVYSAASWLFRQLGLLLGFTLVLGGALFLVVVVKARRAAEPALAGRPRA